MSIEVMTYELGHEGNHEVEETDGLDEGKAQNGVREELATEGGVAGDTVEEGGEDQTDTNTGTSQTDGGGTHTQVLGDLDHGLGDLGRVGALLEGLAGGGVQDLGSLLTLDGLEGVLCMRGDDGQPRAPSQCRRHGWAGELRAAWGKFFNVRDMVRLAATEVIWARMAGRAALVPMDEASLEAATRTEAIVMDGDVV